MNIDPGIPSSPTEALDTALSLGSSVIRLIGIEKAFRFTVNELTPIVSGATDFALLTASYLIYPPNSSSGGNSFTSETEY